MPEDSLAINELMYDPSRSGASYVELFNRSTTFAFDLGNWRLDGLGYTFPAGAIIAPQQYLVLARDPFAYALAHPGAAAPFDAFAGTLQNNGETLKLLKPAGAPGQFTTITRVTYEAVSPWPTNVLGTGASLQLIDAARDSDRVGNWTALETNAVPQWRYVTQTGVAGAANLYLYLTQAGSVYLDDLMLVAGSTPGVGLNLMANGDFENGLNGWTVSANHAPTVITGTSPHGGAAALALNATSGGSTQGNSVWQTVAGIVAGQTYTLSYWWRPADPAADFVVRFSGSWIYTQPGVGGTTASRATPGQVNSVVATLAAFPTLRINEAQAENTTGIQDRFGEREPWIELFNHGPSAVSLNGVYLADNYTNLTQWAFPVTASLPANSFLVVFADNQPGQANAVEFHTNFRLSAGTGRIALSRVAGGTTNIVD